MLLLFITQVRMLWEFDLVMDNWAGANTTTFTGTTSLTTMLESNATVVQITAFMETILQTPMLESVSVGPIKTDSSKIT